jgi:hypothetical protein
VTSEQLSPAQVECLHKSAEKMSAYLRKLTGRMHQRHFPASDPLKRTADKAHEAIEQLEFALRHIVERKRARDGNAVNATRE